MFGASVDGGPRISDVRNGQNVSSFIAASLFFFLLLFVFLVLFVDVGGGCAAGSGLIGSFPFSLSFGLSASVVSIESCLSGVGRFIISGLGKCE